MPHLLSVDDLSDAEVLAVLSRAREFSLMRNPTRSGPVVATVMLTPSMRTRVGFAIAAARLGGSTVEVSELRIDPSMSAGESFEDALRTLTGMADVVVTRTPFALDPAMVVAEARCPVINGGDGPGEHPSQALIDLAALHALTKPLANLEVVISGDVTMRGVRSLLKLLGRFVPGALVLCAPPSRRDHGVELTPGLSQVTREGEPGMWSEADVLYLPGLPARRGDDGLDEARRRPYAFRDPTSLADDATVLSPLPVIDEISRELRKDPRVAVFKQSDDAVAVRMALIEHVLQ